MKVICNRSALVEALNIAGQVVALRTPKPILQCVRLEATENQLVIAATDLETAIVCKDNEVEVQTQGVVVVPAEKLREIARESVDEALTLELNGELLEVRGQDSVFKVYTQPPDGFPPVPGFAESTDFAINSGALRRAIGQTIFAAAKEATRYAFNGVLLSLRGKRIHLVATDGRRLAQAICDLNSGGGKGDKETARAIVPTRALSLVEKLSTDGEEILHFKISENHIVIQSAKASLNCTLLEGQFPPYEDVIPRDPDKKMTANTADFLSAVRRSALMYTDEVKGIRMAYGRKGLVLSVQAPNAGEATVNFACKYEGADIVIGFNPVYLIDALRVVDSEEVTLEMSVPNRPGMIRGGPNFLYVIMPVSVS